MALTAAVMEARNPNHAGGDIAPDISPSYLAASTGHSLVWSTKKNLASQKIILGCPARPGVRPLPAGAASKP
jgi:hypothetical protein